MVSLLVTICVVVTTILGKIDADKIPGTDLLTDTNYQISLANESGFNLLTTTDISTKEGGGKFVQVEDHQENESQYSPGTLLYSSSLWTFKLSNEQSNRVTIHNVMYPTYKLVINEFVEAPGNTTLRQNYLIVSNLDKYNAGQDKFRDGLWIIYRVATEPESYLIENLVTEESPFAVRHGKSFYKWIILLKRRRSTFKIKAVV